MTVQGSATTSAEPVRRTVESVVIRFAGDSGDGIQVTGGQFGEEAAIGGSDIATFPDYPSEIRAPQGSVAGVSSYQIQISGHDIHTPGDRLDALVAFNPAALKAALKDLKPDGILIADAGAFTKRNLQKAGYEENPLDDGTLSAYRVLAPDISTLTKAVVDGLPDIDVTSKKEALRAKNMWALGLVLWLYGRGTRVTRDWIEKKFANKPEVMKINSAALEAGFHYGDTVELPTTIEPVAVPPARLISGEYRAVTGADAVVFGLIAGAERLGLEPVYCSYPITPASTMLHLLAKLGGEQGVRIFQAEDEIAAACAAIGASYAGGLGITGTSGPGMALKTEALGLAVAAELPLVVVNVQRGGPSTGLPTKTEQSDLYQAVMGRNGDTPLAVLAVSSPSDGFDTAMEAVRIAVDYMTPVVVLTDGFIANASEPWRIPDLDAFDRATGDPHAVPDGFKPYMRDPDTLKRPWVVPGTPGVIHRIGGLEREDGSGAVSYDPDNHQRMTDLRRDKILGLAKAIPDQAVSLGENSGDIAVVGWGSTFGPITDAVERLIANGRRVSHIHLRHIWPLPKNLKTLLSGFKRVLVPELNTGQLVTLIRAETLIDARSLSKVSGRPFAVDEIIAGVEAALGEVEA